MGTSRVTVRNLEIVEVDTEDNVLLVKGAVPGPNGGYVVVRRAKR
jgi:large subunit ribosomal protein L3